jgi:hypothetical protein
MSGGLLVCVHVFGGLSVLGFVCFGVCVYSGGCLFRGLSVLGFVCLCVCVCVSVCFGICLFGGLSVLGAVCFGVCPFGGLSGWGVACMSFFEGGILGLVRFTVCQLFFFRLGLVCVHVWGLSVCACMCMYPVPLFIR